MCASAVYLTGDAHTAMRTILSAIPEIACEDTLDTGLLYDDTETLSEDENESSGMMQTYGIDVRQMQQFSEILGGIFVVSSILTFFSSAYSGAGSPLDAIVVMMDAVCIDVISAFFVLVGALSACVFMNVSAESFDTLMRDSFWSIAIDLHVSSACCILLGSVHALIMHSFKWSDIWFTVLECVTTLRTLDFQQSTDAPHAMNVAVWPLQSLMWCLFAVRPVFAGNRCLNTMFPQTGNVIITILSMAGIILFTVFGMLHRHSNIFYANACSVTYRSLEFNFGVHLWYLNAQCYKELTALRDLVYSGRHFLLIGFGVVWWSEVGTQPAPEPDTTCLRLYHRNSCLQDHHVFFLRGCLLGVVLALKSRDCCSTELQPFLASCHSSRKVLSAIAFCWPVAIAVRLVLIITFGSSIVNVNRAVVSLLSIPILLACVYCYDELIKPELRQRIEPLVEFISRKSKCQSSSARLPGQ